MGTMKHHLVLKLRTALIETVRIPDWQTFITDKSALVTSLGPTIDAVLHSIHREFWVTHEYAMAADGWSVSERLHGLDRTYRIIMDSLERIPDETLERLSSNPDIEQVHQLFVASSPMPRHDYAAPMASTSTAAASIGTDFAHALTLGRPDITIAVLDTGVSLQHPELVGVVHKTADFVDLAGLDTTPFIGDVLEADDDPADELGHGTHVAGIIAAQGLQMEPGMAPRCRLLAGRVLATMQTEAGPQGAGIVDNINPAVKWAVDSGANIINMSVGIRHTGGGLPHADVIAYALGKGVTVVAASGNDGTQTKYYPGALPGVIAVGACDDEGSIASFNSFGARISVVAPGVRILSSYVDRRYAVASGTSQAAPHVAGAVALLLSLAADNGFTLGPSEIMGILRATSDRVDTHDRNPHAGYGRINLSDAFKWLLHTSPRTRARSLSIPQ